MIYESRRWKDSNVFIRINNKYSCIDNITFNLKEFHSANIIENKRLTVEIIINGIGNVSPCICYSDYCLFFDFIFKSIFSSPKKWHLFEITIEKDLSCSWRDLSHAEI